MSSTSVSALVAGMPAPAAAKPSTDTVSTPAVNAPSTIDVGDFAAQLLKSIAPAAADAAGIGIEAFLSTVPMGALITDFIGPTTISNYVGQAMTALEATVAGGNVVVNPGSWIETTAASLFNTNESHLATFLGDSVGPTISALVAKLKL
jgi:hypothetical protein